MKREKINNTQLLIDTNLRIQHFHNENITGRGRSMTVAYIANPSTLEIATAIVHPKDRFCRKLGTKQAVEAFLAGKVTSIPRSKSWRWIDEQAARKQVINSPSIQLKRMFG